MGNKRFTICLVFLIFLFSGMMVSCQKDQEIADTDTSLATDSTTMLTSPGNFLAVKGTLKISIQDSTYTFDAAKDSIAFVSVHSGNSQYFGITAINKNHNMSFGISSPGYAASNTNSEVAGSQFLSKPDKGLNVAYALSNYAAAQDFGKISLTSFKKDSVLAKGTFYTFLAKDAKPTSPIIKVNGSFSLQLK